MNKVVVIRGLLDCGILEPVPLVRGVLGVVGRLLEVPRVVVFPLAGKNWFRKKRQDPVDAHHLKTMLLERVEASLVRGEFLVDLAESLVYVEQEAVRHGALGLDRQGGRLLRFQVCSSFGCSCPSPQPDLDGEEEDSGHDDEGQSENVHDQMAVHLWRGWNACSVRQV